jgi:hypothetical protein
MITMSESCGKIYEALALAQGKYKAVKKTAINPFFESKYAPLDEIIDATKDALAANGICSMQMPTVIEAKFVLVTRLGHSSGEWIQFDYPITTTKQDAQGYGSAVTYARRYALQAILGVAAETDDDGNAASDKKIEPKEVKKFNNPAKQEQKAEAPQAQPQAKAGQPPREIKNFAQPKGGGL